MLDATSAREPVRSPVAAVRAGPGHAGGNVHARSIESARGDPRQPAGDRTLSRHGSRRRLQHLRRVAGDLVGTGLEGRIPQRDRLRDRDPPRRRRPDGDCARGAASGRARRDQRPRPARRRVLSRRNDGVRRGARRRDPDRRGGKLRPRPRSRRNLDGQRIPDRLRGQGGCGCASRRRTGHRHGCGDAPGAAGRHFRYGHARGPDRFLRGHHQRGRVSVRLGRA